jgi:hypothetical protein
VKDVPIRRLPSDMVKYRWGWPLCAHLCLSLDYLSVCVNYSHKESRDRCPKNVTVFDIS